MTLVVDNDLNCHLCYWFCISNLLTLVSLKSFTDYKLIIYNTGWNYWWCLYGSIWPTYKEWEWPCQTNRSNVTSYSQRNRKLQDSSLTSHYFGSTYWAAFRYNFIFLLELHWWNFCRQNVRLAQIRFLYPDIYDDFIFTTTWPMSLLVEFWFPESITSQVVSTSVLTWVIIDMVIFID